jgi:hypothetical protein
MYEGYRLRSPGGSNAMLKTMRDMILPTAITGS